jgi:hypothetical protein
VLARTRYFYVEYAPEQLREQGHAPEEFIELTARVFQSMYLPGEPVRFFSQNESMQYLNALPAKRGLLVNLLFSHDASPRAELMGHSRRVV